MYVHVYAKTTHKHKTPSPEAKVKGQGHTYWSSRLFVYKRVFVFGLQHKDNKFRKKQGHKNNNIS